MPCPARGYNTQITLSMVPSARQPLCSAVIGAENPCMSASISAAAPRDTARKPSPPGPTRQPDTRSSSAAGGLWQGQPCRGHQAASVEAPRPARQSRAGHVRFPTSRTAAGRACLSVHPSLAWFSGSGTLSLWVKGWDPRPMAQPGKLGPDVRAPLGMQSRGHGNGDFPAGPRPRASAPCAGRCPAAPESRLGRKP